MGQSSCPWCNAPRAEDPGDAGAGGRRDAGRADREEAPAQPALVELRALAEEERRYQRAAAFSDMFATWWKALGDTGAIPFGEIEGVGLSDSAKLVEDWGWRVGDMVRRYVTVGLACLAALALVYAWGVREAWRKAQQ